MTINKASLVTDMVPSNASLAISKASVVASGIHTVACLFCIHGIAGIEVFFVLLVVVVCLSVVAVLFLLLLPLPLEFS